jgi:hypothetical protein
VRVAKARLLASAVRHVFGLAIGARKPALDPLDSFSRPPRPPSAARPGRGNQTARRGLAAGTPASPSAGGGCDGIGWRDGRRRKNAGASWMKPTATGVMMGRRRRESSCEMGEMGCRRRCEGAGGALKEITRLWEVSSCSSAPSRRRPVVSCARRDSEVWMACQRAAMQRSILQRGGTVYTRSVRIQTSQPDKFPTRGACIHALRLSSKLEPPISRARPRKTPSTRARSGAPIKPSPAACTVESTAVLQLHSSTEAYGPPRTMHHAGLVLASSHARFTPICSS